jgi:3-vinyl bacteriochlorophyllide hydratase
MTASLDGLREVGGAGTGRRGPSGLVVPGLRKPGLARRTIAAVGDMCDMITQCPWGASAGRRPWGAQSHSWEDYVARAAKPPLYSPEQRRRRDASPWTLVQGVLAPTQFLIFAISLGLVARYLATGQGYALATASIIAKTCALYAIMITGSIWEKVVFGKWLFARAFFWEDVFSLLVIALQTAYLLALICGWGGPEQQMLIAVAAYAVYVVNATQFLLKLRAARLEAAPGRPRQAATFAASGGLAR